MSGVPAIPWEEAAAHKRGPRRRGVIGGQERRPPVAGLRKAAAGRAGRRNRKRPNPEFRRDANPQTVGGSSFALWRRLRPKRKAGGSL